jgi:putative spermidine/putrescine transport system ATP-binding protein
MSDRRATTGGSVELVDLRKRFGEVAAVDGVSIKVEPGEFLTLLGPSGSGKTTTLMMVAGFADLDAGRIWLDGRDITDLPAHKRNIGVVFQNYAMFPHMTAAENIGFSLRMREVPAAEIQRRVAKALELVQLQGMEGRYPRQLSGGQQQRVALARALVFEPSLLLLDEPLGALDRLLREHMKLELRRVHHELGTSMIYVTHDQDEALVLSDRIAVMNQGRVEQIGKPDEIYERPVNPFVARFIGESNFLRGTVERVSDGLAAVMVGEVSLRGSAAATIAPKTVVDLSVRPEKITLKPATQGAPGDLLGVVEDRIYSGDVMRYVIRLPNQAQVTVKQVIRSDIVVAGRGDAVSLSWSPREAMVFLPGEE